MEWFLLFDIKQTLVSLYIFILSNAIKGPKLSECNYKNVFEDLKFVR